MLGANVVRLAGIKAGINPTTLSQRPVARSHWIALGVSGSPSFTEMSVLHSTPPGCQSKPYSQAGKARAGTLFRQSCRLS
jgi:hypothetical protein